MLGDAVAEDVTWLISHLRAMVATDPAAWARHETLTLRQITALHFIRADDSLTLTGLASALGTRPPATCAMVDRLADAGMVRRVPDPEHHARVRFQLTAEGMQMLGKIDTTTARRLQAVLESLGAGWQQDAVGLLGDLVWQCLTNGPSRGKPRRKRRSR